MGFEHASTHSKKKIGANKLYFLGPAEYSQVDFTSKIGILLPLSASVIARWCRNLVRGTKKSSEAKRPCILIYLLGFWPK